MITISDLIKITDTPFRLKARVCGLVVTVLMLVMAAAPAYAQRWAVKTNLLSDALLNVNGAVELGVAPKVTVQLCGSINTWTLSHGRQWKHWLVQPEVRRWFCDRFSGSFVGAHLLAGQYNFGHLKNGIDFLGSDFSKLGERRYQGWAGGLGVAYGYAWALNRHWNIEAEIGVGWLYTRYDSFKCIGCGKKLEEDRPHNYFGPTKAALSIVYTF